MLERRKSVKPRVVVESCRLLLRPIRDRKQIERRSFLDDECARRFGYSRMSVETTSIIFVVFNTVEFGRLLLGLNGTYSRS